MSDYGNKNLSSNELDGIDTLETSFTLKDIWHFENKYYFERHFAIGLVSVLLLVFLLTYLSQYLECLLQLHFSPWCIMTFYVFLFAENGSGMRENGLCTYFKLPKARPVLLYNWSNNS